MLRAITAARVDPELFALSYDFVGDLAETIALIWPAPDARPTTRPSPRSSTPCAPPPAARRPQVVERLLDRLDASGRFALLKLVTGGLRVGVSARLAKQALADLGAPRRHRDRGALARPRRPPYVPLFAWLDRHRPAARARRHPLPPGHALPRPRERPTSPASTPPTSPPNGNGTASASRPPPTPTAAASTPAPATTSASAFPDLLDALDFDAALDGELLVRRDDGGIASFSDLQQRLNRKTVTPAQLRRYPAHLRAYDLLQHGPRDLRPLPFAERRAALEALAATLDPARLDLSPLLPFATWDDLAAPPRRARPTRSSRA